MQNTCFGVPATAQPAGSLALVATGTLHGTTSIGGDSKGCGSSSEPGCGIVFSLHPASSGYVETVDYTFCEHPRHLCRDGANPSAGVVVDTNGAIIGTTGGGGLHGAGTVFELKPQHAAVRSRYTFQTIDEPGAEPVAALTSISRGGLISGYAGTGQTGDPSSSFIVRPPYGPSNCTFANVPHARQTQVTAVDDNAETAGAYVVAQGTSHGFVRWHGALTRYSEQPLFGLNAAGETVWSKIHARPLTDIFGFGRANRQRMLLDRTPTGTLAIALGINDAGDLVGLITPFVNPSYGNGGVDLTP